MPRLWSHDCDRSQPRDSRSFALDRARRGARLSRRGDGRIAKGSAARLRPGRNRRASVPSRSCRKRIRILSSTAKRRTANTMMTITRTTAGMACAVSSSGSRARPTKCMCACCSAAIAPTPLVRAATADGSNRRPSIIASFRAGQRSSSRCPTCRCALSVSRTRDLLARSPFAA